MASAVNKLLDKWTNVRRFFWSKPRILKNLLFGSDSTVTPEAKSRRHAARHLPLRSNKKKSLVRAASGGKLPDDFRNCVVKFFFGRAQWNHFGYWLADDAPLLNFAFPCPVKYMSKEVRAFHSMREL